MKKVIVPVDFSGEALNAAHYACHFAHEIQADIVLIHFLPLPVTISEVPLPLGDFQLLLSEAENSLSEIKEKLSAQWNDKICITVEVSTESFLQYILALNSKNNITYTMVMGATGRGATEAFVIGSFSVTAAKNLRYPLIIVPKECVYKKIEKIGLACDMENVSQTLPIKIINSIVDFFKAKLEILYISDPNERVYSEVLSESKSAQLSLASLHPEIRIATNESVEDGLFDFSEQSNIDLLIVIPKERNFIQKLLHKSISRKLVLHPKIPVMLLHEQQNFRLL